MTQLSESALIYLNRKLSDHGNVFEGEIKSGVYGVRVCAIKIDRKSEQIISETRILTKLGSHPHVISIIQSGIYKDMFEDRAYVALDKCHEQNLHQHITHQNESGQVSLNEALEYSKQIVSGVTYIHENLIIHNDLKPSNILLSHDKSTIKIADFGLSEEIKSKSSKVYCKHQFGTNGFRPIESFGNNWVSLKSDTFSLGVVIYFVLSNGKSPFGYDISLWNNNIQNGEIDLSHLLVANHNTFQHLIQSMLNTERSRRPSIGQVSDHPCWAEEEIECNFDYGFTEEIDDSDAEIAGERIYDSSVIKSEMESRRKLLEALHEIGYDKPADIIVFDWKSKHLQNFNPRRRSMTKMHEFNDQMKKYKYFSVVFIGRYFYVLVKRLMYRLRYNDATATWERMADLIDDHGLDPPAVVVSEMFYVVGSGSGKETRSVEKYDPAQNRWDKVQSKQLATNFSTLLASKEYLYCVGGSLKRVGITNRIERFNVALQTWDEIEPMREARQGACVFESDGKVIVAGGRDRQGQALNSVEKYDPDVKQWTNLKPMIERRSWFRCYLVEGTYYAIGSDEKFSTVQKYDPAKDDWELFECPVNELELICETAVVKMTMK